jgi:hypothetical protein
MQVSASAWMNLVMSAFLGFLALTVVLATFYVMRSWSVWLGRTRGRRLPAELGAGYGGVGQVSACVATFVAGVAVLASFGLGAHVCLTLHAVGVLLVAAVARVRVFVCRGSHDTASDAQLRVAGAHTRQEAAR